jgi:hypothetical protein
MYVACIWMYELSSVLQTKILTHRNQHAVITNLLHFFIHVCWFKVPVTSVLLCLICKSDYEQNSSIYTGKDYGTPTLLCLPDCWLRKDWYVSGRSCYQPPRNKISWLFLCPQANSVMVPKFQIATARFSCSPYGFIFIKIKPFCSKGRRIITPNYMTHN